MAHSPPSPYSALPPSNVLVLLKRPTTAIVIVLSCLFGRSYAVSLQLVTLKRRGRHLPVSLAPPATPHTASSSNHRKAEYLIMNLKGGQSSSKNGRRAMLKTINFQFTRPRSDHFWSRAIFKTEPLTEIDIHQVTSLHSHEKSILVNVNFLSTRSLLICMKRLTDVREVKVICKGRAMWKFAVLLPSGK
ncbi:hypothetical protein EVAR_102147_1 [Eumeta japonica]|uniref:Uncharacterized protein n=1 Tax=Eumeta variegata TaxID=151549 RepID=A0A4C1TZY0_EUMVA|nr:hypothetical protein EVAR_102147_1 [Eumeta japonica]